MQAVLKLADEVGEKKSATDNAEADERAQRIEKLYNTAAGLDKFATAIPMLIERLTALKAIHEKGADFAKTVAHLDATQKQLEAMFANDKKMLEKVCVYVHVSWFIPPLSLSLSPSLFHPARACPRSLFDAWICSRSSRRRYSCRARSAHCTSGVCLLYSPTHLLSLSLSLSLSLAFFLYLLYFSQLSTTFAENAAKIEANFKATEERIKGLESKLKK